jgi:hypothetical protein
MWAKFMFRNVPVTVSYDMGCNVLVPLKPGNFLTNWATISSTNRALLHGLT